MRKTITATLATLTFLALGVLFAQKNVPESSTARIYSGQPAATISNANNWSFWIHSNAKSGIQENGSAGGIYPRGTGSVIFEDGLLWGGFVLGAGEPEVRVGGQTYRQGTQPGWIQENGDPVSPDDTRARVYRIRIDIEQTSVRDLASDAAEIVGKESLYHVDTDDIDALIAQYETDREEWPVDLGAPWIDHNENGVWDPGIDEPGIRDATQVIWLVVNDLDSTLTTELYGSPPIGIEQQITMWSYDLAGALGSTIFRRDRIINKSGYEIEEMRLSRWSDPDIGRHTDDLVGCDTVLNMGFGYNGFDSDADHASYGLSPAAAGYVLLHGPIVPAADSQAIFNFKIREGFTNLDLNTFGYFAASIDPGPPPLGIYEGTLAWYTGFRGYVPFENLKYPIPWITGSGPNAGEPTHFILSGDPVNDPKGILGDVDNAGDNIGPRDRSLYWATGPFNMAPGDTQEVVVALIGGGAHPISEGFNHQAAVAEMKEHAASIIEGNSLEFRLPIVNIETSAASPSTTNLSITTEFTSSDPVDFILASFSPEIGDEESIIMGLFDDGQHDDGEAGDGIWGNTDQVLNRKYPYQADILIISGSDKKLWEGIASEIQLRESPRISEWHVIWENGQQDEAVNPGETAYIGFEIENPDPLLGIDHLAVANLLPAFGNQFSEISHNIPPASEFSADSLYLTLQAAGDSDSITVEYLFEFDGHLSRGETTIPIAPWQPEPGWGDTLEVLSVNGVAEHLTPIVANPDDLTGFSYLVSFQESEDSTGLVWSLYNETLSITLLYEQQVDPDPYFLHPVVHGIVWKIVPGTAIPDFDDFQVVANANGPIDPPESAGASWQGFPAAGNPTDNQQVGEGLWLVHTADNGERTTYGDPLELSGDNFLARVTRGGANWDQIVPYGFEIRFTAEGSWAWDPYNTGEYFEVPFELWNIGVGTPDDDSDDYRMVPLVLDDDASGSFNMPVWGTRSFASDEHTVSAGENDPFTDWIYWYNPSGNSWEEPPGDEAYQLAADEMAAGTYTASEATESMVRVVLVNWNGDQEPFGIGNYNQDLPEEGTVFRILSNRPNLPGDSLRVVATPVAIDETVHTPLRYHLAQNYPNPFNPTTTIHFQLPVRQHLKLVIFDVLGRKIFTAVNQIMSAGEHEVIWDGTNGDGLQVGSGIYFYRLSAGDHFEQTKKMILLK